jgi:hypothetical protein
VTRFSRHVAIERWNSDRHGHAAKMETASNPSVHADMGSWSRLVHKRTTQHHFFLGLAFLLTEDFGLVAGLAFLPDLHPHVLHILEPIHENSLAGRILSPRRALLP